MRPSFARRIYDDGLYIVLRGNVKVWKKPVESRALPPLKQGDHFQHLYRQLHDVIVGIPLTATAGLASEKDEEHAPSTFLYLDYISSACKKLPLNVGEPTISLKHEAKARTLTSLVPSVMKLPRQRSPGFCFATMVSDRDAVDVFSPARAWISSAHPEAINHEHLEAKLGRA